MGRTCRTSQRRPSTVPHPENKNIRGRPWIRQQIIIEEQLIVRSVCYSIRLPALLQSIWRGELRTRTNAPRMPQRSGKRQEEEEEEGPWLAGLKNDQSLRCPSVWGIWKIKDKRDVLAGRGKSPPDDDGGPSDESGSGVVVVAGNWTRSISWSFVRSFVPLARLCLADE